MMSFQAQRELLAQVAPRYGEARGRQKSRILDEFLAATGYQRKYALRLLRQPPPFSRAIVTIQPVASDRLNSYRQNSDGLDMS
jgi:hypothetical protein